MSKGVMHMYKMHVKYSLCKHKSKEKEVMVW